MQVNVVSWICIFLVYWVEGSAVEVSITIMNPLPFDIKVENMVRILTTLHDVSMTTMIPLSVYSIWGCCYGNNTIWSCVVTGLWTSSFDFDIHSSRNWTTKVIGWVRSLILCLSTLSHVTCAWEKMFPMWLCRNAMSVVL